VKQSCEPVDANQMGRETSMKELALDLTQQVLHPEMHGKFLDKVRRCPHCVQLA